MIYEYKCSVCSGVLTIERTISDPEEVPVCCQQITSRLWSAPVINFKGSGFYSTDN